jgi:drug/metabolite transporter (DMT)-like permease
VFALLAAASFAASQVAVRRGLVTTTVVGGLLVSLGSSLAVLTVAATLDPPTTALDRRAIALFAMAGVAAPGVARWAAATGVRRLGPSTAVPIMQGARPLLATVAAVLLLAESLSTWRAAGLALIVAGGWSLSRHTAADADPRQRAAADHRDALWLSSRADSGPLRGDATPRRRAVLRRGAAFPLMAGLCYASADILIKQGLLLMPNPATAALISTVAAVVTWGAAVAASPRTRTRVTLGSDIGWQVLSGVLAGTALLCLSNALGRGDVTLVSPILASQPLMVFILSRLLLRDLERLRMATVLAGCSIVAGTLLVAR